MTPQELKNSILQLAIQGKLVEQRPEEGTAEDLYKQIQAEKHALIKARKIRKEKPLPEITEDEIPFEIPESWMWCYVGELFQHNTGKALNSSDKSGTPMTYITTSNLYWDHFELEKLKEMPFTESEVEKCTVQKGDLLVCEGGDYGRSAIWPYDYPMRIQNHIHRLRAYGSVSVRYFYYCFYLYKNAGMIAGKGIAIQGLSANALHELKMPLPPLAEQKHIVAKIEELLPLIDRYEKAWSRLEDFNKRFPGDMQKSILQMAIQGKLVEQRPEEGTGEELLKKYLSEKKVIEKTGILKGRKNKPLQTVDDSAVPYELPDNWIWVRLGNLVEIFGRIGFRGYTKQDIVEKGAGAITISPSNIDSSGKTQFDECTYISWEKYEESPEIKIYDGDIILVKTGSSYGKCGIVISLPEKATINPQLAVLKYILCDVEYLNTVLKSPMARTQFEQFVIGTSIPTFSQEKLSNMLIPLPPLAEQKRIVARLEELLQMCERLK